MAIAESKASLMAKIDYVAMDDGLICQDLDKFRARVTQVEDQVSSVEEWVGLQGPPGPTATGTGTARTGHRH